MGPRNGVAPPSSYRETFREVDAHTGPTFAHCRVVRFLRSACAGQRATVLHMNTTRALTQTIARLLLDADRLGAAPDVVADLWAMRALPVDQQMRRLPEWQQMRHEWLAARAAS